MATKILLPTLLYIEELGDKVQLSFYKYHIPTGWFL